MLAFSIDYYGIFFGATQSVELFCTYIILAIIPTIELIIHQFLSLNFAFTKDNKMKSIKKNNPPFKDPLLAKIVKAPHPRIAPTINLIKFMDSLYLSVKLSAFFNYKSTTFL